MCSQRYSPEFKDEAVHQVLDRGHPVTEVAQRLGVSGHSLADQAEMAGVESKEM